MTQRLAKKPRLLIVIGLLNVGGSETHLLRVLPRLKKEYDITLFSISYQGVMKPDFEREGIPVICGINQKVPMPNQILYAVSVSVTFSKLIFYLLKNKFDVIHFFLPGSYLLGGIAALLLRRNPLVMSRRSLNCYQKKHRFSAKIERFLHRRMTRILANSKKVATQLEQEGVRVSQLGLIYNGVDLSHYQPDLTARQRLSIEDDVFVISIVANFFRYKGHRDLLQALTMIKSQLPEKWLLLCAGRDIDNELQQLDQLARQLDIREHVRFLGPVDDTRDVLNSANVGVLCSHEEGFSNAILEFMASRKPMVVTNVGGNAEAVEDGVTGFVVPSHDPHQIGAAILRLSENASLREAFGMAGYDRVCLNFSLERCVSEYDALYRSLIDERRVCVAS